MTQIMKASDLAELSELGKAEFEINVINGPRFKGLIAKVEEAAFEGCRGFTTSWGPEEEREFKVIQQALLAEGYSCELSISRSSVFGFPYLNREIKVSW